MAAKVAVAVRLDPALVEWADGYAAERGVSRQVVLESAIDSFVDDCERGVPELRAAVRRQAYARDEVHGIGDCPRRGDGLGHVFRDPREDPVRPCKFCGVKGRGKGGHLSEVTAERSDVFSRMVVPMVSGSGNPSTAHPKGLSDEQQALAGAVVEDKRRRDREAVEAGTARPAQVAGVRAAEKRS